MSVPRLHWPVKGRLTQAWMMNPANYARFNIPGHNGLDIAAPLGTDVVAIADGVVAHVDNDPKGYGLYVRVWHPMWSIHSFVAHLSEIFVKPGQPVLAKDVLGKCGSTGNSTGAHVHLEIRAGSGLHSYDTMNNSMGKGRLDPLSVMVCSDKWCEEKPEG